MQVCAQRCWKLVDQTAEKMINGEKGEVGWLRGGVLGNWAH